MAREHQRKEIIIIGGSAGHGKDSLADRIQHVLTNAGIPSYRTAFAYGIKKILHESYGTPWEILNGVKDVKESTFVTLGGQKTPVTVRRALQGIGQFHRETFGPTCWAAATLNRCLNASERICIVTDARHPAEEIHWMKAQAEVFGHTVTTVRIRRQSVPLNLDHPSEALIAEEPDRTFDVVLENNETLGDLSEHAKRFIDSLRLLRT